MDLNSHNAKFCYVRISLVPFLTHIEMENKHAETEQGFTRIQVSNQIAHYLTKILVHHNTLKVCWFGWTKLLFKERLFLLEAESRSHSRHNWDGCIKYPQKKWPQWISSCEENQRQTITKAAFWNSCSSFPSSDGKQVLLWSLCTLSIKWIIMNLHHLFRFINLIL